MKTAFRYTVGIAFAMTSIVGCVFGTDQPGGFTEAPAETIGGANVNDRTPLGGSGEPLLTGVMEIAPSGNFAIMQRNTATVLLNVKGQTAAELPTQMTRVVISKVADVAYALYADGSLVALNLALGGLEVWRTQEKFSDVSFLRVADDAGSLVVVNGSSAVSIDPNTGAVRGSVELPSTVSYGAFLPSGGKVVLVGHTVFTDHKPATPVSLVDLIKPSLTQASVPNCEAPISVLPNSTRVLLSPTFCQEDRPVGTPADAWTNPDQVSILDIDANGISFLKNLPGFGPVALSTDGNVAVAYLDMARIDKSMFEDPSQIPGENAAQYHIMVIEPKSLAYKLYPVGNGLPRFAITRDGKGLLVDASIQIVTRVSLEASANATVSVGLDGVSGDATASLSIFGTDAPFGYFDLATGKFNGFKGPKVGLDRFVQLSDNKTIMALSKRPDGLGGNPFRLDIPSGYIVPLSGDYGIGIRDIGLLPDGVSIVLRFRQHAMQIGADFYARETYCTSPEGVTCNARVEFQASTPFYTIPPPPPPAPNVPPPPPAPPPDYSSYSCREAHDC